MRIAFIADDLSIEKGGGIARTSQQLLAGLMDKGVEVELICIKSPNIPYMEAINHIFRLPHHTLKRIEDFDLVHATTPITGLCFPFIKKPKVMTYRDLSTMLCKYSGNSLHARVFSSLFFRIGHYSDKIIAISQQTKEELIAHVKLPKEKITVINHGIDGRFKQVSKKGEKDCHIVGFLGALSLRKRVDYLLRAFHYLRRKHPELKTKLFICGTGKELSRIARLVEKLDLTEDVEFKGFVPDGKIVEIYNLFDVFVLPSEWEGFGNPILEAQKCGVPVIIREDALIPHETGRYCIKAISEEDMADKLYELFKGSNLRKEIVKKGLEYSKQFTWERTVEETIKVYEEVLRG